jgi:hypothetical protein
MIEHASLIEQAFDLKIVHKNVHKSVQKVKRASHVVDLGSGDCVCRANSAMETRILPQREPHILFQSQRDLAAWIRQSFSGADSTERD